MTTNHDDIAYIRKRVDDVYELTHKNGERIAQLEVKAGFWGMLGGVVSGALLWLGLRH